MRLVALIFILIFASGVHAFTMNINPEGTINVPTLGSRDIILTLSSNIEETVSIDIIEADSRLGTTVYPSVVQLEPGKPKNAAISVSPSSSLLGQYPLLILAKSITTENSIPQRLFINVYKGEIIEIQKLLVSGEPVPLGNITINAVIKNYKTVLSSRIDVEGEVFSPSRKLFSFSDSISNIDPGDEANIKKSFTLQRYAEPGVYRINIKIKTIDGEKNITSIFNVNEKAIIEKRMEEKQLTFGYSKLFIVTNNGNYPGSTEITEKISGFDRIFFYGSTPTDEKGDFYTWKIENIEPGQTVAINYRVDYLPLPVLIIAVIILSWILYIRLRSVRIKKYIIQKKELQEGEEFTVGIEIKNSTGRKIDLITVRDIAPPVFEVKDAQSHAPVKKKTSAGTELTWTLKDMHNKEERLVSYKLVPLLGVSGQIRLPRASVIYKQKKKEIENKSMYALIGINTEKGDKK